MPIETTTWPIEPHTEAKHEILRRYLDAWFPILAKNNQRIIYVDGFAGPGKYSKGEDGSPVIAINRAANHRIKINSEIVFVFIEKDTDRFKHLEGVLKQINMPANFKCSPIHGSFDETMTNILQPLEEQAKNLAPSFVFIDPFGIAQTPFSLIQKIMKNKRCEVLITFMYNSIDRCVTDHPDTCTTLFGGDKWKQIKDIQDSNKRIQAYHDYYKQQLEQVAGIKYVRSFKMTDEYDNHIYCLFFGTNNLLGLERMKDSMWAVDKTGRFKFSDNTDPNQTTLFGVEPDYDMLKKMVLTEFKGKKTKMKDLEEFVLVKTPFKKTGHLKRAILQKMEKSSPPEIKVTNQKKAHTYPPECEIEFL